MSITKNVTLCMVILLVVSVSSAGFGSSAETFTDESGSVTFAGGSGTEGDPYLIENVDELQNMSANLTAHYELINDIDATETSDWNGGAGFDPVGNNTDPFTGSFDGKGYTVKSLYIDRPGKTFVGLFGCISQGGSAGNVSLTDTSISGDSYVGGLAGSNRENSHVFDSDVSGEVSGATGVGVLLGRNVGTIRDSFANGTAIGSSDGIGGLVGSNGGTVETSQATVYVDASGTQNVGGLIGASNGPVNNSYATGDVSGGGTSGGLLGSLGGGAAVNNSYSRGNVSGSDPVGGLIGVISESSLVKNSYSTGQVTGGDMMEGGLIGYNDASSVEDSFWDTETSGMSTSAGGTGKTTAEMKDVATFTDTSTGGLTEPWDFVGDPNEDTGDNDTWDIDGSTNDGYPFLARAAKKLTINIQGNGTVEVDGQSVGDGWNGTFQEGDEVELKAVPDTDWAFENWTGDHKSGENVTTVKMDDDKQITANFYEPAGWYALELQAQGNGTVEVDGKEVQTPFTKEYPHGEEVKLSADPDDCNEFVDWTGINGTEKEIFIIMDENKSLTAQFQEIEVVYNITDWNELCTMRCDLDGDFTLENDLNETTPGYNETHVVSNEVEEKFGKMYEGNEANSTYSLFYSSVEEILSAKDLRTGSEVDVDLVGSEVKLNEDTEGALLVEYRLSEEKFLGWEPVGEYGGEYGEVYRSGFTGSFDGQGNEITGLNISRPHAEEVGLFRHIEHGSVDDVGLVDVNVVGNEAVGGLGGRVNGSVTNAYVTGEVTGGDVENYGNMVGGLAGVNGIAPVEDSYASVKVEGKTQVGGLVGLNVVGAVNNSYAAGNVYGKGYVGGLVGSNAGNVTNSHALGDVEGLMEGNGYIGGLVGYNGYRVENSYATGEVSGNASIGGLIGIGGEVVKDSYSNGSVSGDAALGGLIGTPRGDIINSHYNISQVKINGENHLTVGGIFDEQYQDWIENKELDIENYNDTLVPVDGYYEISDVEGIRDILGFSWDEEKDFRLGADINLSGAPGLYIPYLDTDFSGNGHTISNLQIDLPFVSQLGFFGQIGEHQYGSELGWNHNVSDLRIKDADVTGGANVGGLVGYSNDGGIYNSSVTGNISGTASVSDRVGTSESVSVGGLVGYNERGAVDKSHAEVEVRGNYIAGGLVGWNRRRGRIIGSYSAGKVDVYEQADKEGSFGGLVGMNSGTIETSYSDASVNGAVGVGGLVGANYHILEAESDTTIENSFATGDVTGSEAVGGLVGGSHGATIKNSYASGNVIGDSEALGVGGLIGGAYNGTLVKNSYSTGGVNGGYGVGGLVGYNKASTVEDSFWDTESSGQGTSAGGTGKTTAEMKDVSTYTDTATEGLNEPWDFVDDPNDDGGYEDLWDLDDYDITNDGYPFLSWQEPEGHILNISEPVGNGTIEIDGENVTTWPYEEIYDHDTEVVLTAVAEQGWFIDDWNGTEEGGKEITLTMDEHKWITPEFAEIKDHLLTIDIEGEGTTVPSEGLNTYEDGEEVTITAHPEEYWEFENWTGDHVGDEEQITITMDDDKSITANFKEAKVREISDWYDLDEVRAALDEDYVLLNDLNQSTAGYDELVNTTDGWDPIGEYHKDKNFEFTGTFDGNGHEIRDLYIDRNETNHIGLFGIMDEGAEVKNIGVVDADVNGGDSNIGIIVGTAVNSTVNNSYAAGTVRGNRTINPPERYGATVGGLVGWNAGGTVKNSYASGEMSGLYAGGLVGVVTASGGGAWTHGSGDISMGTVENSHYNIDEVLIIGENRITVGGLFDAQYKDWIENKKLDIADYSDTLTPAGGYYEISDAQGIKDLLGFAWDDDYKFRLADDIDLSAEPGLYIPYLAADFDGAGHNISNLYLDMSSERSFTGVAGMFGVVDNAKITNIGMVDADVSGGWGLTGGLVGANNGTVKNSYVTGTVSGDNQHVGGLVGGNAYGGTVENSYSEADVSGATQWVMQVGGLVGKNERGTVNTSYATGTVSGDLRVGGLVGENEGGSINNSYATGSVDGESRVGGLVGSNPGSVKNSYATGSVSGNEYVGGLVGENTGTVSDSFWNTETSGTEESDGGTGKTTAEMKDVSTYTDTSTEGLTEAWDFVGDPNDDEGDRDIWDIDGTTNDGYPFIVLEGDESVEYTLTINIVGNGTTEPSEGAHTYKEGTEVTIKATADDGWYFENWTGDYQGPEDEVNITMDSDKDITANFEEGEYYNLTVNVDGEGSVARDPDQELYEEGTEVALTASPSDGWYFDGWTGDLESGDREITLTMDSDKTLTAHFGEVGEDEYVLTIDRDGEGTTQPGPGDHVYSAGEEVTIEAMPDEGWQFVEWTGDNGTIADTTANQTTITMDENYSITALFEGMGPEFEVMNFTVEPTEGETPLEVTITAQIENVGYSEGTITLETDGIELNSWTLGPDESADVDENHTYEEVGLYHVEIGEESRAVEVGDVATHTLEVTTEGNGTVEVDPDWDVYENGTEVDLTAHPDEGWQFIKWTGTDETGEEITITMDSDMQITAHFEEVGTKLFDVGITNYDKKVVKGEDVTIEYTVHNPTDKVVTEDIILIINGEEVVVKEDVTLEPGEEKTLEYKWKADDVGEFTISTDDEDDTDPVTVTVEEEDDGMDMTLIGGIVAVIVIILALIGYMMMKGSEGSDTDMEEETEETEEKEMEEQIEEEEETMEEGSDEEEMEEETEEAEEESDEEGSEKDL
ncbi:MAG: hypothetical protein KGY76_07230 [Candidatus Thermoplasmatota archaeon]|nr:hypothetical protein [Candidatus Thermoplasmatota archaeon]